MSDPQQATPPQSHSFDGPSHASVLLSPTLSFVTPNGVTTLPQPSFADATEAGSDGSSGAEHSVHESPSAAK